MTDPTLARSTQVPVVADPASPASNRRSLLLVLGAAGLVAVLVLALAVLVNGGLGGSSTRHAAHVATGGVNGRSAARLDVVSGVTSIAVRTEDLGGDLYRISTPDESDQVPRITDEHDIVSVGLAGNGDAGGPAGLEIVLSTRVTWQLLISGGAQSATVDLRKASVSDVELASGISTVELWLPAPTGTATLRETGGASDFTVHGPADVPARLTIAGGAGSAVVDGVIHTGVTGKTVFSHAGWERATNRWDVWLVGGVTKAWLDRQ